MCVCVCVCVCMLLCMYRIYIPIYTKCNVKLLINAKVKTIKGI